ncbi:hypothetical protein MIT9_P1653 [Methylomarinovum caldicuralii]|uniref:GGDEF domain-containing protein n=1 Tax=Methylomarinovum caldicuralii TaxID=438856 RepID=A0AAU9CBZ8_9GAMM|nr:hypothetical protein MIT9_P1653 [Methylomarinovum caldicuralii]
MVEFFTHVRSEILDERKLSQLSQSALGRSLIEIFSTQNLTTYFQPIVDLQSHQVYAVEALTRGPEQSALFSPLNLFRAASDLDCLEEMDWLARQTAIGSYKEMVGIHQNRVKLFLNVTVNLLQKGMQQGRTLECLRDLGLSPAQVVIELTELQPVENYEQFLSSIRYYREMGFSVSVDDLGSGYNGLRIWSEVKPDYVKIDRHFIQEIHRYPEKQNFLEVMVSLSKKMGTKVIAEGIETPEELSVLETLGVDYVQGFLLARPQPQIVMQPKFQWQHRTSAHEIGFEERVESLIEDCVTVPEDFSASELGTLFLKENDLEWVVVVDKNHKPMGMFYRDQFVSTLAKPFMRELYTRKKVTELMDKELFVFDSSTSLIEASRRFTNKKSGKRNAFVVRNEATGKLMGVASFISLLKAMTNLQIQSAQYANPLTRLPGNKPIKQCIQKHLSGTNPFAVIYVDVDNFKPFNDHYSFEEGDQVIIEIARILSKVSSQYGSFVGHIGGDDFVLIMDGDKPIQQVCERILLEFRSNIERFYSPEDQKRGGIRALNREGEEVFFPLMSLSLGVLKVNPQNIGHPQKLASEATKAKKAAKHQGGNTFVVREV